MTTEYWRVDRETSDVVQIAEQLIDRYHPDLQGEVAFVMRLPAAKRGGRVVMATASKMSAKVAALIDYPPSFIIEVADDAWKELDLAGKRALIDHELCHCAVETNEDGETKCRMRDHDLEEFEAIARRHGPWDIGVQRFVEQLEMFKMEHLEEIGRGLIDRMVEEEAAREEVAG